MLRILQNKTMLKIQNVICFYVGMEKKVDSFEELKDKKKEDWTYEDYLTDSCGNRKLNLTWLNKETVTYKYDGKSIDINDDTTDTHINLNKENIHDTIIFQGQSNDNNKMNYEGLMRAFEYMGFFMLNTIDEINIASDKYLSANLLSAHGLPQPKYILVTKDTLENTTTNHDDTRKSFWDALDSIYDKNMPISDAGEMKYVCKILGGSLGIGVFICNRKEIESILQTMFAINKDIEFIIQEYKDNSGDIRVHLFSVDGKKYEVLACMKRNRISHDFRSNVSLGATTDKYELSDEQKEIVLKTAAASGCRWVGVDLMDCEDGSNLIIEYNSSPGVQGISQQIKKNMFDIVFDKINEYLEKYAKYDGKPRVDENTRNNIYSEYSESTIEELRHTAWNNLSDNRMKIIEKCLSIKPGTFYKAHGKTSPEDGLDCSGYIKYIYKDTLDIKLPNMCVDYFTLFSTNNFEKISKDELQPGDIGIKNESTIMNHCGIYAGNDLWFESCIMYGVQLTDYDKFEHFFRIKTL